MSTTYIYIVQHVHKLPNGTEDVKLIGAYSTELEARQAVGRLRSVEGFSKLPEAFTVDRYELDKDHWVAGFVTK